MRVSNLFDRRYETFGALAPDLFPHGRQLSPHEGEVDVAQARFVAPGAARAIVAGLRTTFKQRRPQAPPFRRCTAR